MHDIDKLDKDIRALKANLESLHTGPSLDRLLEYIRFKGWTTPAEYKLVASCIAALNNTVSTVGTLRGQLIEAAAMVGRE
jgi:hypothetical protein